MSPIILSIFIVTVVGASRSSYGNQYGLSSSYNPTYSAGGYSDQKNYGTVIPDSYASDLLKDIRSSHISQIQGYLQGNTQPHGYGQAGYNSAPYGSFRQPLLSSYVNQAGYNPGVPRGVSYGSVRQPLLSSYVNQAGYNPGVSYGSARQPLLSGYLGQADYNAGVPRGAVYGGSNKRPVSQSYTPQTDYSSSSAAGVVYSSNSQPDPNGYMRHTDYISDGKGTRQVITGSENGLYVNTDDYVIRPHATSNSYSNY